MIPWHVFNINSSLNENVPKEMDFMQKSVFQDLWEMIILRSNCLQDLLSSLNSVISTNESTEFITGHVIYNLAYTYKF